MGKKTPLYECHVNAGAKIVDFAGWDMPLHYGSQLEEHHVVRAEVGIFDVSHMRVVDIEGNQAQPFLEYLLANNVGRLQPGKALYSCMLNEGGGILDDLIVYKMDDNFFRIVVNSGTAEKDIEWMRKHSASYEIQIKPRADLAIIAAQGPKTDAILQEILDSSFAMIKDLKPFHFKIIGDYFIARTGYTGEQGVEIILSESKASDLWQRLIQAGAKPCGLGARDTLRLEAGLNLYGADMDEQVTPLESNLAWTVAFTPESRDFIGRKSLETQLKQGIQHQLVGLVLEGQGVLRNHQKVKTNGVFSGEITSGSFSPTLNKGIALARIPQTNNESCYVDIRGKESLALIIKPPFVRHGKKAF